MHTDQWSLHIDIRFDFQFQDMQINNCVWRNLWNYSDVLAVANTKCRWVFDTINNGKTHQFISWFLDAFILNGTLNYIKTTFSIQFIVRQLQELLDALKGSPVGLKLNVDLNNFFLDSFRYHVDLWAAFLGETNCFNPIVILITVFHFEIFFNFSQNFSYYFAIGEIFVRSVGNNRLLWTLIPNIDAGWSSKSHNITRALYLHLFINVRSEIDFQFFAWFLQRKFYVKCSLILTLTFLLW